MSNNFDPSRFFNAGFNFGGQDQQQQAPPPSQQQQQAFQQPPPHHVGGGGGPPPPQQQQQQQQPTMTDQQRQMLMMSMALGGNGNGNPNANANVMAAVLSQLGPQHQNLTPQQMQAIMQQWRFNPGNFAAAGAASAAAQNGNGGQQQQQQGQQPRPPPPSSSSSIPIQQSPNLQHQFQQQQQQQQFAALQQQQQRQQQQQQLAHQQQPNQPPSQGGPSNNKSGGGFPPAAISGAQAASAASQAAAFNRQQQQQQQQQQQGLPPGFNQHFGQQQQPSPQINNMAPGGQLQGQLPSQISQLAVNITDEQLRSWQDKEKHGHFSDQQKAQLAMIVRLREELKGKAQPEQQQAGPSQPRPPPARQQQQQQQGAMRPPQPQQGGFPGQPVQGGAQANPMMAAQNQMQQPQRGAWPNGNQQGPPPQHAARMGPPPQAQQQQRQGPPQGAGVNMQNYQMGGAGIRPPPQQQQQQGGGPQLSDSANKALLVEAAARDPKKLFLTFAERLKALEARINHPQTSEADRQSARQQMAGSKVTFQSVINELTSTGKLPVGFQSAANAVMSNPSALAHQMQQQQQQQQQAAQQGQSQQQQHQQGTPTLATRTPAAVGQMFSPPTMRTGHQAGSPPNAFASPALNAQQTTPHLQNAAAFGQQVPPQQQHQQPQAANARPPQQQQQWNVGAGAANAQPQAQSANSLFPLNQENFMRVLTDLLPRRGVTLKQPVMVGGHPIDLWTLYQTVSERNGMQAVSANSAWPAVVVAIGLAPHGSPEAYTLAQPLADAYRTYLMPFEGLWKHAAATMANQRANQQQQQQASQVGGGGQQQAQPGPQGQAQHQQPPGPGQMNARPPPSAQQLAALQMQQQQQLQQQQGRFAQPPQAPAPQQQQQQQQQVGPPSQAGQLPRPPPPTLSQAQIQQLGIDQERFNEMWRAGSFQPPAAAAAAANNGANPARPPPGQQAAMQMQAPQQQQQPQMPNQQQNVPRPAPSPAHQQQQQQPQPSAPFQPGTNGQGQASPPAPRPSGGDPSRQITKENFEAAKERLLKIDEEFALNRPGLKDPRPVSDEERKQIFAFVGSLSVLSEETHVLMPALGAMMGNDFEAAGGRKAKLMLWLLRDQMWFMRTRNECRFGLEDIRRMAYQFKKLTDYVKTGSPQIAEYLLKDHAARRMAGAPSWFSLQPPFPSSYPDAPTQGQSQSWPQTGPTAAPAAPPAGSLPVDEATAAQMGIKRGLRVDDLKLPPSKRKTTGGGTPGTPTNQGSSPTGMPLDASPAGIKVGDSPKPMTGGASPPSSSGARGGKRGASTAAARGGRGKKARGGGAAGLSSSQDDAIAASPKPKAKTSADIMAEVKAEMAAEAERKRREEADRAAAGIEDPARNPFLLAEEAAKKEAQARGAGGQSNGDELDYVMNAWQDMLDAGQANGGGGAAADGSWANPLQSMLALVGASPAAVAAAGQTTAAATSSAPAPASQTAPTTLSQLPDTDIFFDFDSFDGHEEDGEATTGERDPREEVATALGLVPFAPHATAPKTDEAGTVTTSSGTMGETPDLVSSSSSGIPSAASSSTSSSAVLPQATFAHFFDENGFVLGTGGVNGSNGKPAMVSSPMQSSPPTADSGSRSSSLAGAVGGLGLEDDSFWDADHAQLYAKDQESAWAILPGMPS